MSKYCSSPTSLLGFAPWIQQTVKHLGTPRGLLTLNISTDRCRFFMPTNHLANHSPALLGAGDGATESASVICELQHQVQSRLNQDQVQRAFRLKQGETKGITGLKVKADTCAFKEYWKTQNRQQSFNTGKSHSTETPQGCSLVFSSYFVMNHYGH